MIWNKPKNLWHWLALLSPGAVSVAMTAFGKLLPRDSEVVPAILGLPVAVILCMVIAFFLAKGTGSAGKVIGLSLAYCFALVVVNISIALGGCAVMNPYFSVR